MFWKYVFECYRNTYQKCYCYLNTENCCLKTLTKQALSLLTIEYFPNLTPPLEKIFSVRGTYVFSLIIGGSHSVVREYSYSCFIFYFLFLRIIYPFYGIPYSSSWRWWLFLAKKIELFRFDIFAHQGHFFETIHKIQQQPKLVYLLNS